MHQPSVQAVVLTARRAQLVSADESDAFIITPYRSAEIRVIIYLAHKLYTGDTGVDGRHSERGWGRRVDSREKEEGCS
jgi:hypothetical protein